MADGNDPINDSIDDLRAKLEEERAARLAAEGRASTAENQAKRNATAAANTGNEVQRSRLQILDGSIDQMKTQRDIMKARLRDASAEGDHDAVAEISAEMGDVAARLLSLENGKAQLQWQIDNPPTPQPTGDQRPFESLSAAEKVDRIANGLSDKSAAWVRRHPEWASSQIKVNALVGAHNAALARDHIADTAEYFTEVERILGIGDAPPANGRDTDPGALSEAAKARETPPPAAPARAAAGGRTRTLTALEREAAKIAGQTDQEYAAAQDALVREGRITRH